GNPPQAVQCPVGLATGAALFRLPAGGQNGPTTPTSTQVTARIALGRRKTTFSTPPPAPPTWPSALAGVCQVELPDERARSLFDAAVRSLVLHSPGEVYPGPYTYKRFWFRDAAFILEGMLAVNLFARVRRCLDLFPRRQDRSGYFRSQEGEWDSN